MLNLSEKLFTRQPQNKSYYKPIHTAEVQGSKVNPAINWLEELKGSVDYIRLIDPNERKVSKTKSTRSEKYER